LKYDKFTYEAIEGGVRRFKPLAANVIWIATEAQVAHWMTALDAWKKLLGKTCYGNYYFMDYELLGEGARRAIEEQCKQRNMSPVLPPLVPFNSTEWPWRIGPQSGTGPATLEQTM